uniref:2OG-FeII_Oxy_2 domain-containing protein n=1 Tax=Heterorhabditis bacteriophora TaxID=37862 RepID=A0A1I7XAM9_HETBA
MSMNLVKEFHHIMTLTQRFKILFLLSDVVMEFKDGANSARIIPVLLKKRSLCLIQGESRYRWKHGIVNRKHDIDPITHRVIPRDSRISLTLRKIRTEPCQCNYKEFCDWDRQGIICFYLTLYNFISVYR